MEIIDELEPVKGPYGGVVGYLDFSGNIDTAITIRTMLCQQRHRFGAGRCRCRGRLRCGRRASRVSEQGQGVARRSSCSAANERDAPARPSGGIVVTIREAVRVSGPDAAAYLQGQISQDIESLADGEVAWSLSSADGQA